MKLILIVHIIANGKKYFWDEARFELKEQFSGVVLMNHGGIEEFIDAM